MYRISRTYQFSASHVIHGDKNSMESGLHGHNFTVKVEMKENQPKNSHIYVIDPVKFDKIGDYVFEELHGKHLNDVFGSMAPTNENICHWLYYAFKGMYVEVCAVEVSDGLYNNCRFEI